ncbi:MAG: diacylglycerol kinase family protein [Clostridia bacterium]|nr:diacylglycerol kinase family protein [Clostridia bacterium]MDR3643556.1 diacylglycerol kinase family protein [Clostridia bacterium]
MSLDDRLQEVRSLTRSFKYAFHGVAYCVSNERNMRIHLVVTAYLLIFSLFYGLTATQYAVVALAIGMVLAAEAINTAVEVIVNMHTQHYDSLARIAKDIAAGAVLICTIFAVVIGCMIFLKPDKLKLIADFFATNLLCGILFLVSLPAAAVFIFSFPFKRNRRRFRGGR